MLKRIYFGALVLAFVAIFGNRINAQQPVATGPDVASWGTAFANPAWATVEAWNAENRGCALARILVSEGVGNLAVSMLKKGIHSERPCLGCAPDGMPSGHTMNSAIGISRDWGIGIGFTVGTGILRVAANRHTWPQVVAGAGIGIGADWLGRHVIRCD